uniref:EF-hand domain-containing protein n=1 Tax=Macrostomum lignano TaxID=282301 RepID=A0A1I8GL03_9PLAT
MDLSSPNRMPRWPSMAVRSGGIGDPHPAGVPDEGAEVSDIVRGGQLVHPLGVAEVFVPRLVEVRAEGDVMLRGLLSYATEGTETFLFRLGMAERLCLYSVQLFQWSCAAVEQRAVGEAVNALAAPVHTDIQRNVVSARDGGLEAPPDVEGGRSTIHIAQVHSALINDDGRSFELATCQMLVNMFDSDRSGTIDVREPSSISSVIGRAVFVDFDASRSRQLTPMELGNALNACTPAPSRRALLTRPLAAMEVGLDSFISLNALIASAAHRYRTEGRGAPYEDFLLNCIMRA